MEDKRFYRDGFMFTMDASPILENSRVYMPIGFVRDFMKIYYHGTFDIDTNTYYMEVD